MNEKEQEQKTGQEEQEVKQETAAEIFKEKLSAAAAEAPATATSETFTEAMTDEPAETAAETTEETVTETEAAAEAETDEEAEPEKENGRLNFVLKITLGIIIAIIVGLVLFVLFRYAIPLYKSYKAFEVYEEESVTYVEPTEVITEEEEEEEPEIRSLNELRSADDLSTALREWSENTEKDVLMKSKNVVNFLLIGCDEQQKLADVIMIVSLNRKTKQIFLTSVMRDSYTYIPIKNSDTYGKINSAYIYGGAQLVKSTIERDFKIDIDYYVSVNYDMFMDIVNTLGGIELEVQEYEARAVETDQQFIDLARAWNLDDTCPYGEQVTLNGLQALTFCRIRYCDVDADVSRTRRQRQFIAALIEKTKSVKIDQIDEILDQFSKYMRTDCPKSELASMASQAILNKWYNYEIISNSLPQEEERMDYSGYAWVWIVDYPLSAYNLHNLIYGESNIILSEDRISVIDIMQYTGNVGTAAP